MKIIGIVGGIGSGKSTLVDLLSELANTYIINADHIGHSILKKGNPGYLPAIEAFGSGILGEDGEINRSILGSIVFSDPLELQKLNQISHPLIYQIVKKEIELAQAKETYDYIIIDAALLIEIKLIDLVDQVWGVYVPLEIQVQRVMARNGLSKEEAEKRIASQLPWNQLKKVLHLEIDNGGTRALLKENLKSIIKGE